MTLNEQYLAGTILLEESVIWGIDGLVTADDFQSEHCRAIFEAAKAIKDEGGIIDSAAIKKRAQRSGVELSYDFLVQLMELTPTTVNFAEYAKRVAEDARIRRIKELAAQIQLDETSTSDELTEQIKVVLNQLPEQQPRKSLTIISAQELQAANIPPVQFLVDGILPEGTSLICAASKIGKSWMVLDLGLSVAAGEKFLGRNTHQSGVLYLALEDSEGRLQSRMNKVLQGAAAPSQFYFSTEAPNMDDGLLDLVGGLLDQHPEIKLVIIDTLQKIRGKALPREGAYETDYRIMGAIKKFGDKRGVSLLFVHHIRKMKDDGDPFNMISGTNGIMGAADTSWLIAKDRNSQDATLHITGRDVAQAELVISFDKDNTWKWCSHGSADWINEQRAKLEYQNSPVVKTIRQLLHESKDKQWSGTASDLMKEGQRICGFPIAATPQKMGFALREMKESLRDNGDIVYEANSNGNAGNKHYFYSRIPSWVAEAQVVHEQESIPL